MEFHERAIYPCGFHGAARHCGLKPAAKDLTLIVSDEDAAAAAVFTRNHFPGAPILLGRETIRAGVLRAIVVNSKVSNVATGPEGLAHARRMAAAAAAEVGTTPDRVLVSSTGVIGMPLPIERIERGLVGMRGELTADPLTAVEGMMTTDSHPKAISAGVGGATITWLGKGSGMIAPNMATMLVYILTDAAVDAATLDGMLRDVVGRTFNMLSVDGDTSTSDTCAILANGMAGEVDHAMFREALVAGCTRMTELLARDGEGATRMLRVTVRGAASDAEARRVAKSLVDSPLVKTMVHGADPNVGRILMAVGKCVDCTVDPDRTDAWINGTAVVERGRRAAFDEATVRETLGADTVDIEVALHVGDAEARAWGCDLTAGYVAENAAYYSS